VLCVDAIHFAPQPGADGEIGGPRVWRGRRSEFGVPFVGGGSPGPGGNVHSGPGRQRGWAG